MKPGRELDALVAEKVMGIQKLHPHEIVEYEDTYYTKCLVCGQSNATTDFHLEESQCGEFKKYSTDIAAAWEVVEKLSEKFAYCIEKGHSMHQITVWIVPPQGDGFHTVEDLMETHSVSSCSLPHAICLAAVKAIEVIQ